MNSHLRRKAFTFMFIVLNGYVNYLNETAQNVDTNIPNTTTNTTTNTMNNNNTNTTPNTSTTFIKSQHETFIELLSFQNEIFNIMINDEHIMANIIKDYLDNCITNIGVIQTERVLCLYYNTINTLLYNNNKIDLI